MSGILNKTGARSGIVGTTESKVGSTFLGSNTVTNAQLSLDGFFTSEYTNYEIVFTVQPYTNNEDMGCRINISGSASGTALYCYTRHQTYMDENTSQSHDAQAVWTDSYWRVGSNDAAAAVVNP